MEQVHFTLGRIGSADVVRVIGVLDYAASVRLRLVLFERLDAGATQLVVDLRRTRLIDAGSVDVLLRVREAIHERSGSLRVTGAEGLTLEVLEILDAAKPLGLHDDPVDDGPREPGVVGHGIAPAGVGMIIPGPTGASGAVAAVDAVLARVDGTGAGATPDGRAAGGTGTGGKPAEAADASASDPNATKAPVPVDEVSVLLRRMARLPKGNPIRSELRQRVVERCLSYAQGLARRFHGLGEALADLEQVAAVGLLKAVDGFDPRYSTDFRAYATPTIIGELKRHFRDKGWAVRVPRRFQELRLEISRCRDELTQQLGRSPTVNDLASHLDVDEEQVVEAMVASNGYRSTSLFASLSDDDDYGLVDRLGEAETGYDAIELRESIHPAVARLPVREQRIIAMRFFGNMSQSQIAAELGISQMHVSRLLARSLRYLRTSLVDAH